MTQSAVGEVSKYRCMLFTTQSTVFCPCEAALVASEEAHAGRAARSAKLVPTHVKSLFEAQSSASAHGVIAGW